MVTIKPPSVFDIKILLRKLFDNPNTLFRIIAYNPQNGKVRPEISTYKLYQDEEVVSRDVRTHQLEIAYSAPDEEVLYEKYPSRMECCVDPNEDVPDLCKVLLLAFRWSLFLGCHFFISFAIVPEVSISLVMH